MLCTEASSRDSGKFLESVRMACRRLRTPASGNLIELSSPLVIYKRFLVGNISLCRSIFYTRLCTHKTRISPTTWRISPDWPRISPTSHTDFPGYNRGFPWLRMTHAATIPLTAEGLTPLKMCADVRALCILFGNVTRLEILRCASFAQPPTTGGMQGLYTVW